ncbi:ribosomal protein S18-alanine N-acetyltransferase [uncultured Anaerococcus sp.]|uniref:ribosomal protein S18-alanine N-acetyltransferase n=1 Tax=uncultured Anaerococcus sp. TaxID=293428 RepID=UPI0025FE9419|nr:ribosomal protein S18-alanine N-acetyltransferase [uncultured Anaerococcus sp.]
MIRKMEISDADEVYNIENQAFFEPWSKKNLIKDLKSNSFLNHYVAELDGKVVGFYISSHVLDQAEIFTIAVNKKYKKMGIATALLNHLVETSLSKNIKEVWLEVSTNNIPAINLYKKFGFEIMGIRKNYYQKLGEDAYNMKKEL